MEREGFFLEAYPNPFNPATTITFSNPSRDASLVIYTIAGRPIAKFSNVRTNSVTWDAKDLASGIYVIKLTEGQKTSVKKALLQK